MSGSDAPPETVDAEPGDAADEVTSWDFEAGQEIFPGRYVFRSLGGGSAYEVFLVWDEWLHALMVAKLLRPHRVGDERSRRDMVREMSVLQSLAHPMIVRGYGLELDVEHPHMLLEHLEGDTLRRLVKRFGRIPLEQLLPLALHVASALVYLSNRSLVHLDVKPANIVMSAPPRLIDLSIARSVDDAHALKMPIGTDGYMAPEQIDVPRRAAEIGPATDVFGLGASLFHAVAGQVPFPREKGASRSDDPEVRWPQLVNPPVPLPADTPAVLADLLVATLADDPRDRPSAGELALALEPLVAGLPTRVIATRRGLRAQ